MTQAFNLSQLANKVNTSGQLDASTGLSSAVPVANGGLALTSIAAKSIPVANSANTYTTVTPAAGQSVRVNAGNTAWEAFTPGTVNSITAGGGLTGGTITSSGTIAIDTTFGNVGTIAQLFNFSRTNLYAGSTISGASLGYGSSGAAAAQGIGSMTTRSGNVTVAGISSDASLVNTTAISGTWRCLGYVTGSLYDSCPNTTRAVQGLFIRTA